MSIKTQGTKIYFIDATDVTAVLRRFECPTAITGIGSGGQDEIDTTALEDESRSFVLGLKDQGEVSIPFVFDDEKESHEAMLAVVTAAEETEFIVCFSNGTAEPTLVADAIVAPTGRTSIKFRGLMKQPALDVAGNEVIRGTVPVRINGDKTLTTKGGTAYVF